MERTSEPIAPMTLGNMCSLGVRSLQVRGVDDRVRRDHAGAGHVYAAARGCDLPAIRCSVKRRSDRYAAGLQLARTDTQADQK
jgi:hypothetical protein